MGATFLYSVGRWGGEERIAGWLDRYGKFMTTAPRRELGDQKRDRRCENGRPPPQTTPRRDCFAGSCSVGIRVQVLRAPDAEQHPA